MATTSAVSGSSFAPVSTNGPSLSLPEPSLIQTTQIIPGTTVVGTGSTGAVWSYTIPEFTRTTVLSIPPGSVPVTSSGSTSTPVAAPESTLVTSVIIIAGTTVTGGIETGVPWSYTIPEATVLSSIYVPVTTAPSGTVFPSSSSYPPNLSLTVSGLGTLPTSTSSLSTSSPAPPPQNTPSSKVATLSGGIVAAIFGALLLLIFAIAGFLCLRLRRRRRLAGADWDRTKGDNGVGVVWGRGWGSEEKDQWRPSRPGMGKGGTGGSGGQGGVGTEAPTSGFLGDPISGPGQHLRDDIGASSSSAHIQERGPPPLLSPQNIATAASTNVFPAPALYPQTHTRYDKNANTDMHTRTMPSTNHDTNTDTQSLATSSIPPASQKLRRIIPPPTPHIYAPPPGTVSDTSPTATPTYPYPHRATSPHSYRAASPYASSTTSQYVPKRLSKQRITPTASAFLRHMVPTRGLSLRRPKAGHATPASAPTPAPVSASASSTATPSSAPPRPNISAFPSFIRERQFSPSHSGNSTLAPPTESALFSPSPRARLAQLPSHSPLLANARLARSAPNLVPPLAGAHPRYVVPRDGFLSPPTYAGGRDRYSQMTSTTRSGATSRTRDSRMTGRSADTRMTGRSADTRMTGRSGESRFTGRSGGLSQILEGEREQGVSPKTSQEEPRRIRKKHSYI
ncbi:hypothetical protein CTheo_6918 [Ceratobasidium theobromae]|uniref:Transmembrane protein n=1 Tax=Ceratobasidium theobromae TaxID=1582974 RepID=A0A5N5QD21_9AGAM|nr:hypothetical protein CTheo_6918 [Ceratobasidium theobromae]